MRQISEMAFLSDIDSFVRFFSPRFSFARVLMVPYGLGFISQVYRVLFTLHVRTGRLRSCPWDGITFHSRRPVSDTEQLLAF